MNIHGPLQHGNFLRRPNRFRVEVALDGESVSAHLPNSGRLKELLVPGAPVLLAFRPGESRATHHDLVQVLRDGHWVSTDAHLPNALVREALEAGLLPAFDGWTGCRSEPAFGSGRFDLAVSGPWGEALVEIKSVTLVRDGTALFPDAPTIRGARHMSELARYAGAGGRGVVFFIVQRPDARAFRPYAENDPAFADACRSARHAGVEFQAWACETAPGMVRINNPIPVFL